MVDKKKYQRPAINSEANDGNMDSISQDESLDTESLDKQMAILKRGSHRILWLNPLLSGKDYRPICRGMRAALPYVDYFLASGRAGDYRRIGGVLEKLVL